VKFPPSIFITPLSSAFIATLSFCVHRAFLFASITLHLSFCSRCRCSTRLLCQQSISAYTGATPFQRVPCSVLLPYFRAAMPEFFLWYHTRILLRYRARSSSPAMKATPFPSAYLVRPSSSLFYSSSARWCYPGKPSQRSSLSCLFLW
jgi:hypothetical protein